jgi:MFS family permease
VGNLVYALAISYDSMAMAIGGRIICGFGSAEVVNRQMISGCVSFKQMTRASAYFVAFGALGMSIGPLIAAVLDSTAGRDLNIDLHLPFSPAKGMYLNDIPCVPASHHSILTESSDMTLSHHSISFVPRYHI